jgi:hypothetical protein
MQVLGNGNGNHLGEHRRTSLFYHDKLDKRWQSSIVVYVVMVMVHSDHPHAEKMYP